MEFLEVTADGDALGEVSAVIQLEHWDSAQRVLTQEFGLPIYPFHDVDFLERDLDSFFSQKYPDPARIRRQFEIVDFHVADNEREVPSVQTSGR